MAISISYTKLLINRYLLHFPNETGKLELLINLLNNSKDIISRKNFVGHVTASGFVISHDLSKVLLIRHNFLNKWLQPGGHIEAEDENLIKSAEREVLEETGLGQLNLIPLNPSHPEIPFDIDSHFIPENPVKLEASHFHHDFRYCFVIANSSPKITQQLEEISDCRFFNLDELPKSINLLNVITKIQKIIKP